MRVVCTPARKREPLVRMGCRMGCPAAARPLDRGLAAGPGRFTGLVRVPLGLPIHRDWGSSMQQQLHRSRGWRARTTRLLSVALLAASAGSVPAYATAGDSGRGGGDSARSCPDTRCAPILYVPPSSTFQTWCWRDAGSANGTVRWFRISYAGVRVWLSAAKVASPQPHVPYCNDMLPNETLFAGQTVWSGNGSYRLVMQGDGNLVSYGPSGALWSTRTAGSGADRVIMQGDGNLVLYAGSAAKWNTGTMLPGNWLAVQDDGNVVTYRSGPNWASSWHRTRGAQRSWNAGFSGNCTWYAYERFKGFTGTYPALTGDAGAWNDSAAATGWLLIGSPVTQAIVVFEPYVQGSGRVGHVAWVDAMREQAGQTQIHVVEMNFNGLGVVSDRWVYHVPGMSYIMAPQL